MLGVSHLAEDSERSSGLIRESTEIGFSATMLDRATLAACTTRARRPLLLPTTGAGIDV